MQVHYMPLYRAKSRHDKHRESCSEKADAIMARGNFAGTMPLGKIRPLFSSAVTIDTSADGRFAAGDYYYHFLSLDYFIIDAEKRSLISASFRWPLPLF